MDLWAVRVLLSPKAQFRVGPDPTLGLVELGAVESLTRFANVVTTGDQHLPILEQDRQLK